MTCQLQLYLKHKHIISEDVDISNNLSNTGNPDEDFEINAKTREIEIMAAIEKMRLNHLRAIIKSEWVYQIVTVFQSKMNYKSIINDHE